MAAKFQPENTRQKSWRMLILIHLVACMGASEFPVFRMEEFEQAIEEEEEYFTPKQADSFDIPSVSERFYLEDMPRLPIKAVSIEGVTDYPALGISAESVQALINQELDRQQGIELDQFGFTERNKTGVTRFLRELIDRGGRPDQQDMNDLMRLVHKQEAESNWITIEQLDAIAQKVTRFYREKGLILATAFIPQQEVMDGVVRLRVLEGVLGEVTISNNHKFSESFLKSPFFNDLGKSVTDEGIEGTLRRVNDTSGLRVRGSFSPGQNIGETSLNLNVLEEQEWTINTLWDDHGSPITGDHRNYLSAEWSNAFGLGHRMSFGLLKSTRDSTFGSLDYELPMTDDQRGKLLSSVSLNTFSIRNLEGIGNDITGETESVSVTASYQHLRGRARNFNSELSFIYKNIVLDLGIGDAIGRKEHSIETVRFLTQFSQLWDEQQILITGRAGIEQGHLKRGQELPGIDGSGRDQDSDFTKVLLNANLLKRLSLTNPFSKKESAFNLLVKLNVQYAEQFLAPVEQFSLGGPNAVRSFTVSDVSVDSGVYLGVELYFDLPFDPFSRLNLPYDVIKPYIFYDYGYGVLRQATELDVFNPSDLDVEIEAYGLGVRLNFGDRLNGNLMFAKPKSTRSQGNYLGRDNQGEEQVYFELTYTIH